MIHATGRFAFGIEMECLTSIPDDPSRNESAARKFVNSVAAQLPSLPTHRGIFTGYGRCYCDVGHVEMATAECASPYVLPSIVGRFHTLATRALETLAESGLPLVLANNNHSGLLTEDCPVWGTHENYLVEKHPEQFGSEILPFLVTRIYAGAGGVEYPSGQFLAGVRPTCLVLATGGGTTEARAIHCTIRRSHHTGRNTDQYRYHLICGDGHRSEFNLALQMGATALALKAILYDVETQSAVQSLAAEFQGRWVAAIKRFNVLAEPGDALRVDPTVVRVQRIYLDGARRFADSTDELPSWVPQILEDWDRTLTAYEQMDRGWLAARMDTFAKYELFSAVLHEAGHDWASLPSQRHLFHELELLNQNYHEFGNPDSVFARIESAGLMRHRVGPRIMPGGEPEPFVPETGTRAEARARFIKEHADAPRVYVDWEWARDETNGLYRSLADPFAAEYGEWESWPEPDTDASLRVRCASGDVLNAVLLKYDQGNYGEALRLVARMEEYCGPLDPNSSLGYSGLRYRAWLQARMGQRGARESLERVYRTRETSWSMIADHCNILRFSRFQPDLSLMERWIELGEQSLRDLPTGEPLPSEAVIFQEHVAASLLRNGETEKAEQLLQLAPRRQQFRGAQSRMKARILALQGEVWRRKGYPRKARRLLKTAMRVQRTRQYYGHLSYFTLPCLAKVTSVREEAEDWLQQAIELQTNRNDYVGLIQSMLLQVRVRRDPVHARTIKRRVEMVASRTPTVTDCPLIQRILQHWEDWVAGRPHETCDEPFWNL